MFKKARVYNVVFSVLLICALLSNRISGVSFYMFDHGYKREAFTEVTRDANVIVLTNVYGSVSVYIPMFRKCGNFYIMNINRDIESCILEGDEVPDDKDIYIMAETDILRSEDWKPTYDSSGEEVKVDDDIVRYNYKLSDILERYRQKSWCKRCEKVDESLVQYGKIQLWKLR